MTTDFTFGYGSNMNRSDLRSWLEGNGYDSSLVADAWPARLDGYDFVWNYHSRRRGGGAANLQENPHSTVWGLLIEFQGSLLKAFDRKESHPYFYDRGSDRVPVIRISDGAEIPAWIYIANPNKDNRTDVWPTREYKRICLEAATELGLPEEHLEKMREWPTVD
jgi:gamma-glutamylcyclotransferase (GGCT)/AIG2-like uncharacterized protein YtfP